MSNFGIPLSRRKTRGGSQEIRGVRATRHTSRRVASLTAAMMALTLALTPASSWAEDPEPTATPTLTATARTRPHHNGRDLAAVVGFFELDVLNHGALVDTQQRTSYSRLAHVVVDSLWLLTLDKPETLRHNDVRLFRT